MASNLQGSRVVLGVTGGIAAYKAADLASKLTQRGALVDTLLTSAAEQFITPTTFEAITGRRVYSSVFAPWVDGFHGHVSLGHEAQAVVIAPATAESIARLAAGNASDMLGATVLSTHAPVVIAPAMEHNMFHHPATRRNLETIADWGCTIVGPDSGRLASGEQGDGRMVSPDTLVGALRLALGRHGSLAGRRIVVTAGGTREALDPVRFLGNRSSGLMGYALAQACIDQGAVVDLITGPVCIEPPYGARVTSVTTALEMFEAVQCATRGADALLMAAAVADYRPANASAGKIKKRNGALLVLELEENPDIVGSIEEPGLVKIGFAAETDDLLSNALEKLSRKGLAVIVANDAEQTIGSRESTATLLEESGRVESLPRMTKDELAAVIAQRLVSMLA